jgi:hypothetical protein
MDKEHIDLIVRETLYTYFNDTMTESNSYIDFKDYKPHIDAIYEELSSYGVDRENIKLEADFMGLHITYKRG